MQNIDSQALGSQDPASSGVHHWGAGKVSRPALLPRMRRLSDLTPTEDVITDAWVWSLDVRSEDTELPPLDPERRLDNHTARRSSSHQVASHGLTVILQSRNVTTEPRVFQVQEDGDSFICWGQSLFEYSSSLPEDFIARQKLDDVNNMLQHPAKNPTDPNTSARRGASKHRR